MNYIFTGLKEWDADPHYFKDFTKGKIYHMWFNDEFRMVMSDKDVSLMVSNSALRKYFIETI